MSLISPPTTQDGQHNGKPVCSSRLIWANARMSHPGAVFEQYFRLLFEFKGDRRLADWHQIEESGRNQPLLLLTYL
jgi:hypothetical protein